MFVTLLEAWNHIRHLSLCRHIFFVEAQLEKSSKGRSEFSCSISEYKSGDTVWSGGFVDIKLLKLLSHLLWPKDDFLAFGGGPYNFITLYLFYMAGYPMFSLWFYHLCVIINYSAKNIKILCLRSIQEFTILCAHTNARSRHRFLGNSITK